MNEEFNEYEEKNLTIKEPVETDKEDKIDEEVPVKKRSDKIEKIQTDKIRGRVVILNEEKSEFAKNLKLEKKGDYIQKVK